MGDEVFDVPGQRSITQWSHLHISTQFEEPSSKEGFGLLGSSVKSTEFHRQISQKPRRSPAYSWGSGDLFRAQKRPLFAWSAAPNVRAHELTFHRGAGRENLLTAGPQRQPSWNGPRPLKLTLISARSLNKNNTEKHRVKMQACLHRGRFSLH